MKARGHTRLEPPLKHMLTGPLPPAGPHIQSGTDTGRIGRLSLKIHPEPAALRVELIAAVAVDAHPSVYIADHQIHQPVPVQIPPRRTAGETRLAKPPLFSPLTEDKIPLTRKKNIRNRLRGDQADQLLKVGIFTRYNGANQVRLPDLTQIIQIGNVLHQPIRHIDILVSVVVIICNQHRPAPVRRLRARQTPHLRIGPVAIVQLKRIAGKLVSISILRFIILQYPRVKSGAAFTPPVIGREHIGNIKIRPAVVGQIGDIRTHGRSGNAPHLFFQDLPEGAIPVVQVEVIPFKKIVGYVDVRQPVAVNIRYRGAQAKSYFTAVDSCFFTYIRKDAPIIAKQLIPAPFMAEMPLILADIKTSYSSV